MEAYRRQAQTARQGREVAARDGTKVSIVVPTYNERDNVAPLYERLCRALEQAWDFEVIFVDDASPDGTAGVVRRIGEGDGRVKLLVRPGKLGLGSAVRDGFRMADGGYLAMMDADLSHQPEYLPGLLGALERADIALGSRYVPGGGVENWPFFRRLASRVASGAGRLLVGLKVRDLTSGFAAFRRETIEPLLPRLSPQGFKLAMEVVAKAPAARVAEVPIRFVDRQRGKSKFTTREVLVFLRLCWELRRLRKLPGPGVSQPDRTLR